MKHEISLFYDDDEVSEVEVRLTFTANEWCEFSTLEDDKQKVFHWFLNSLKEGDPH